VYICTILTIGRSGIPSRNNSIYILDLQKASFKSLHRLLERLSETADDDARNDHRKAWELGEIVNSMICLGVLLPQGIAAMTE
jgi:hypothetical protein